MSPKLHFQSYRDDRVVFALFSRMFLDNLLGMNRGKRKGGGFEQNRVSRDYIL